MDADRDRQGGVLEPARKDTGPSALLPREPWWRSLWLGRTLAFGLLLGAVITMTAMLVERFG